MIRRKANSIGQSNYIFDFDSTLIQLEALDELAAIALKGRKGSEDLLREIVAVTNQGMVGSISIEDSLIHRIHLMQANKRHIAELVKKLVKHITPSIWSNRDFFKRNSSRIYVVSSGFHEYIWPVVKKLGLRESNIFANRFVYGAAGEIVGFEMDNLLAKSGGKAEQVRKLGLHGKVQVLGDGFTDYQIKSMNAADTFYAFTENIARDSVIAVADKVIRSFDEFLYVNKLPTKVSYPKSKIEVLLLENVHPAAVAMLEEQGFNVSQIAGALDEKELVNKIVKTNILGIRSKTDLNLTVLSKAPRLLSVGAFCIGTEQIALDACSERGIAVFNAPFSNTRSVVELALGEIIMLLRGTFESSSKLHQGIWSKSAQGSHEVRGRKLGIVGYGNIGAQLSVLAESLGMEVYYFDVAERLSLGNARKCSSLAELLKICEVVTVHIDGRPSNQNFFGAAEFKQMKAGSIFLNLSRGKVVDLAALAQFIKSGRIKGAAVDVFPHEPKDNSEIFVSELCGLPNVILTPHVGGSTLEAQASIGEFVARKLISYLNTGASSGSVNIPNIDVAPPRQGHRMLHIHNNVPGILASLNAIFARNKINVLGQYLKTNEHVGYVISDVDRRYDKSVIDQLKKIPETIKFRVLY